MCCSVTPASWHAASASAAVGKNQDRHGSMPATMALAGGGFSQSPRLADYGGLFQRAGIITGFAWLTVVSARALHRTLDDPSASRR
jgi:hypothetical protein